MKVTSDEVDQHLKREDKMPAKYTDDLTVHMQTLVSVSREPALLCISKSVRIPAGPLEDIKGVEGLNCSLVDTFLIT